VVVGAEFPQLTLQNMRTRDKMECPVEEVAAKLKEWVAAPQYGALLAGGEA
jgi:histidyl-tRNA synthetase